MDEAITSALRTMRHDKVRRRPVVNAEGTLQGRLCRHDLVLRAEEARGTPLPALSDDEARRTHKTMCEHRAPTEAEPA